MRNARKKPPSSARDCVSQVCSPNLAQCGWHPHSWRPLVTHLLRKAHSRYAHFLVALRIIGINIQILTHGSVLWILSIIVQGSSNLAWSYSVINFALQRMLKNPLFSKEDFGLDYSARVALSDSLHIMQQSAAVFKLMVRMLKTPTESQLLSFLRKLKKLLQAVNIGETLMLPGYVEGGELIILLERTSERLFKVVIVQTDPFFGLRHHTTSPVAQMPHVTYRTCMVLSDVPKKNVLDDVFWMALYNMAIHYHEGDTDKFYDVLIPFLTGKPLEASLVEAENAAAASNPSPEAVSGEKADLNAVECTASDESKEAPAPAPAAPMAPVTQAAQAGKPVVPENCGEWRLPQRSNTAYVRCTLEAFHFLLRRRKVTELQAKQVGGPNAPPSRSAH